MYLMGTLGGQKGGGGGGGKELLVAIACSPALRNFIHSPRLCSLSSWPMLQHRQFSEHRKSRFPKTTQPLLCVTVWWHEQSVMAARFFSAIGMW